ncbi:universal stress protein [Nonomuraea sp. NPDC050310]|uniref:universal stress protein n=1 Tax=Nonomuraea sp. NPDC050310 TaxID=3154935 RepID=UPI00340460C0
MTNGRVVVGVDGSPASLAALSWAEEKVAHDGGELVIVHVHEPLPLAPYAKVGGRVAHGDCGCATVKRRGGRLVEGLPARELGRYAAGADVLVLGSNAGERQGEWLGATLLACLRQAPCPVVVVAPSPAVQADERATASRVSVSGR